MTDYNVSVSLGGVANPTGWYSVTAYGADKTGVADSTTFVQAAVNSAVDGATIHFPAGEYKVNGVSLNGKSVTIVGDGCTITGAGAAGAFYKTDHVGKTIISGIWFEGAIPGFSHIASATTTTYDDFMIDNCRFAMSGGAWGVYSSGSREPLIHKCFFDNTNGGNGVYFKSTVAPIVDKCMFKGTAYTGTGIYYPGTGLGYDAGLIVRDCEVMGWDYGVHVVGCDWLMIAGSTIDFNNYSVKLGSQDAANIHSNYIGSLGANPAIWVTYDANGTAPNYSDKIIIENNTIVGHYTGGSTYDCILVDGAVTPNNIQIKNNNIGFYTRYGIRFTTTANLKIEGNTFDQRPTFGVAPVYNETGATDSAVTIKGNTFNNATTIAAMNVSLAKVSDNIGCVTEACGEAFVGAGVSTYNQAHGLSYTPVAADIQLTATNPEAAGKNPYINAVTATNIVIGFTAATGGTAGVAWRVKRGA